MQVTTNQYYFTTSGDVISERYVSSSDSEFDSLPTDIFIDNHFPDVSAEVSVMFMNITFTEDRRFYNTNYRVQFELEQPVDASHHVYMYAFTVPMSYDISNNVINAGDLVVSQAFFPIMKAVGDYNVGDVFTQQRFITSINTELTNNFGSNILNTLTMRDYIVTNYDFFESEIAISDNQATIYSLTGLDMNLGERMPRMLRLAFIIMRDDDIQVSSLKIKNFTLVPIKGTEQYYQDEIFQNDVIGSDEEGEESGLKGIISFLKKLPEEIFSWFEMAFLFIIGSDVEGSESGLLGILAYIKKLPTMIIDKLKELFIPPDDFMTNTVQDMDAFMTDHLGVLYQAPKELIELIRDFISLDVPLYENVGAYKLRMPAITIYVNAEPPPGMDVIYSNIDTDYQSSDVNLSSYTSFDVLPDNSQDGEEEGYYLRLGFLSNQPYSILYNIYRVFSYAFIIVIFLLYCYRRLNAVLGGVNE